jgi:hypothetical protein
MRRTFVVMAMGALLLAGCGGDETSDVRDGVGSQGEPVCEALEDLSRSFAALGDISIDEGALAGLQAAVGQIQTDLQTVKDSADGDLASALGTFESTLQEFGTSLETVVEAPSAASIAGLATELADVQQAWGSVQESRPDCGG